VIRIHNQLPPNRALSCFIVLMMVLRWQRVALVTRSFSATTDAAIYAGVRREVAGARGRVKDTVSNLAEIFRELEECHD